MPITRDVSGELAHRARDGAVGVPSSHVGGSRERGEHAENRVDVVVISAALGSGCVEGRVRLSTRNAEGALPR